MKSVKFESYMLFLSNPIWNDFFINKLDSNLFDKLYDELVTKFIPTDLEKTIDNEFRTLL
jgi:hypothetical protein